MVGIPLLDRQVKVAANDSFAVLAISTLLRLFLPNVSPDPLLVAALMPDGFYGFEYQLVAEVYGLERPEMGSDWYRLITSSETNSVTSRDGRLRLDADTSLEDLPRAGTIIVPGWPLDREPSAALRKALLDAHQRGSRLVSICSGAFLLAELGVLVGRSATTLNPGPHIHGGVAD